MYRCLLSSNNLDNRELEISKLLLGDGERESIDTPTTLTSFGSISIFFWIGLFLISPFT